MKVVSFDTETHLIRQGLSAPPISCLSWESCVVADGLDCYHDGPHLVHWTEALPLLRSWLTDPNVILVGHNVAFDLAVVCAEWPELIPLVYQAYEENRITDTMLRQKLIDIANGCYRGFYDEESSQFVKLGYSLIELAKRRAGIPIKKEGFRLFYGPLRNVPLSQWVEAAKELQRDGRAYLEGDRTRPYSKDLAALEAALGDTKKFFGNEGLSGMVAADPNEVDTYPRDDARTTMAVYLVQEDDADLLADQYRQARAAWWLHLTSAWGLRTNASEVGALQLQTQRTCDALEAELVSAGLVRKDGSRDTKLAKQRMLDVCGWHWDAGLGKYVQSRDDALQLRLTPAGEPQLDADACKATEDSVLVAYAELTSLKAVLNKDIPMLARATVYPVHTHFDLAETGRRTSSNPNVQNVKRI